MSDRNSIQSKATAAPVERDNERFKLLFTNSRPKIPADYTAPLGYQTSRELIGERLRASKDAESQASCV
jgi:hypothetical protein